MCGWAAFGTLMYEQFWKWNKHPIFRLWGSWSDTEHTSRHTLRRAQFSNNSSPTITARPNSFVTQTHGLTLQYERENFQLLSSPRLYYFSSNRVRYSTVIGRWGHRHSREDHHDWHYHERERGQPEGSGICPCRRKDRGARIRTLQLCYWYVHRMDDLERFCRSLRLFRDSGTCRPRQGERQ